MFQPTLCIYHGNCADGFAAALAVWLKFGDAVKFHPGVYGQPAPDVTGERVLLVDFSYKRNVIEEMTQKAEAVFILDHHKSAQEDLQLLQVATGSFEAEFDMQRSGAMMAWDYFMGTPAPALFHHIQDRDLWQFKLEGTREIQAALFSYPYDFTVWADLLAVPTEMLRRDGVAIERKHFKDLAELLTVSKREMVIGGQRVPVANLPYTMASDAGHAMAKDAPFAATYYDGEDRRFFSLRSVEGGMDVSEIAKAYGGGGHKHAAGFSRLIGWEGDDKE